MEVQSGDDRAILQLADELATLKGRLDLLEDGTKASQLKYSSIENGAIAVFDREGLERLRLGLQPDGSFTTVSQNNPDPPPVPRIPLLTAGKGTIKIQSQGSILSDGSWPADFSHLRVFSRVEGGLSQLAGTIAVDPGVFVLGPLDYVPVEVWFTAVNHSGTESAASEVASTTPQQVVGADLLEGTVTALQLASEAVERAKIAVDAIGPVQLASDAVRNEHIQAGSITGEQVRANTLTALNLVARTITGLQIEAETILGEHIAARTIDAEKLQALSITANEIAANAVTAAKIVAGSVTADKLEAVLILATEIIAGDPTGGRVAFGQEGIDGFDLAGRRVFQLNNEGDLRLVGIIETGIDGSIVRISPGDPNHPLQTPGAFFYADESNFPAMIYSTPAGNALGVRPSSLQLIASLDDTAAAGHISLRDNGMQLGYHRVFGIGETNSLIPVGGSMSIIEDGVDMRVFSQDASLNTDGGVFFANREMATMAVEKSGELMGALRITDEGLLAMAGRVLANHGDPNVGIYAAHFAVSGGNFTNITYGSTITNWAPRLIGVFLESPAATMNFGWISSQNSSGFTARWYQTGATGLMVLSIGLGVPA